MTFNGPLPYFLVAMWLCPVVAYFVQRRIPLLRPPTDRELQKAVKAMRVANVVLVLFIVWVAIGTIVYASDAQAFAHVAPKYTTMLTVAITGWLMTKMWKNYLERAQTTERI